MALWYGRCTGWLVRQRARTASVWAGCLQSAKELLRAFLNIDAQNDSLKTQALKTVGLVARKVTYTVANYWLAALCLVMVAAMKGWDISFYLIVVAVWVYNIVIASVFVFIYAKTDEDPSLGADLRRVANKLHSKSQVAAYVLSALVVVWAAIWDGPEKVVTFFWRELRTTTLVVCSIVALSALEGIFWASTYSLGCDLFVWLWHAGSSFLQQLF